MEAFAGIDYSGINAKYSEAVVMAQVSQAERWVNKETNSTFTAGAAPDGVKAATLVMAKYFMSERLVEDGYLEANSKTLSEIRELALDYIEDSVDDGPYSYNMMPPS